MGQVFVRGWQLRAAVILLILLSLGLLPGAAKAWTSSNTLSSANPSITFTAPNCGSLITGGNPDSTFCTGVPNFGCGMVDPTAVPPCLPGGVTCDLALTNPCPVDTSPTTCPLQSADQINEVCQHFALNVAALGTVSACIVFPHGTVPMDPSAENVVDIFVVQLNAMGQAVAVKADTSISTSSSPGPTPGTLQVCASFDSPAGATAFDV